MAQVCSFLVHKGALGCGLPEEGPEVIVPLVASCRRRLRSSSCLNWSRRAAPKHPSSLVEVARTPRRPTTAGAPADELAGVVTTGPTITEAAARGSLGPAASDAVVEEELATISGGGESRSSSGSSVGS